MAIQVMIVDDSAVVRQTISSLLSAHPEITVAETAADPLIAAEKLKTFIPDVIVLDIEMPRMDGLTFLRTLMKQHPLPVVMCSSMVGEGSNNAFQALEYGAVDIILKPRIGTKKFLEESAVRLQDAVLAAHMTKVKKYVGTGPVTPRLNADSVLPPPRGTGAIDTTEKIAVIGASTGGTEAIREVLEAMPVDAPGIVIVQHMPEKFTEAFAKRLDSSCAIKVREAKDNDSVLRGTALIAPGNKHTVLRRSGARYYVNVEDGPLVSRHRPSVDVLFRSAATYGGKNVIGVIMTGMGSDGAEGLRELKDAGAITLAQDEASCVVFGMPREAIQRGAAAKVIPLSEVASEVLHFHRG